MEPTKELIRVCVAEGGGIEDEGNMCNEIINTCMCGGDQGINTCVSVCGCV